MNIWKKYKEMTESIERKSYNITRDLLIRWWKIPNNEFPTFDELEKEERDEQGLS